MNELQTAPEKLKTTLTGAAEEAMMMRGLCGLLNDPALTGAEVPQEVKEPIAVPPAAPPLALPKLPHDVVVVDDVPKTAPAGIAKIAEPVTPAVATDVLALFFTGGGKAGKSYLASQLGAVVVEFIDPVIGMAKRMFGPDVEIGELRGFLRTMTCWGEGVLTPEVPLTAERGCLVELIRTNAARWDDLFGVTSKLFGTPDFWTRCLLARVSKLRRSHPKSLVAVTSVPTEGRYIALKKAGFRPYHVLCNNLTRSSRGGNSTVSPLVNSIDRDITKNLSTSPQGPKLWAVWCDEKYPSPSKRLLSVGEFLTSIRS